MFTNHLLNSWNILAGVQNHVVFQLAWCPKEQEWVMVSPQISARMKPALSFRGLNSWGRFSCRTCFHPKKMRQIFTAMASWCHLNSMKSVCQDAEVNLTERSWIVNGLGNISCILYMVYLGVWCILQRDDEIEKRLRCFDFYEYPPWKLTWHGGKSSVSVGKSTSSFMVDFSWRHGRYWGAATFQPKLLT